MDSMLQDISKPIPNFGVELSRVFQGREHKVLLQLSQGCVAVPQGEDTAKGLHGDYSRAVLITQQNYKSDSHPLINDQLIHKNTH
jgi:hypothetical protein